MRTKRLFLASSCELQEDRREFEVFINRKNKDWVKRGVFIDLVVWEDFLDIVSRTRLQEEYNQEIRRCDLFVMLFWTKVGQYTAEEFETAFGQFQATNRPFIFTYFKDAPINTGSANQQDLMSLWAFQAKLDALSHFYTRYQNLDTLKFHFNGQLDKLAASGFITFAPDHGAPANTTYQATLNGSGAIAQGGGTAVGTGSVSISGSNTGRIVTGTRVETGGGAYMAGRLDTGGGNSLVWAEPPKATGYSPRRERFRTRSQHRRREQRQKRFGRGECPVRVGCVSSLSLLEQIRSKRVDCCGLR